MTDKTDLAIVDATSAVVVANLTTEQIELVRNTVCKDYSDVEMNMYLSR